MSRELHILFRSTLTRRIWSTSPRPALPPDDMPDGQLPWEPMTTPSSTKKAPRTAKQMPCPGIQTSFPLPFPPSPSFHLQIPFSIPLTSSEQQFWSCRTIPSSLPLLLPKPPILSCLHTSNSCRGGPAGSQTPHCQKAAHRAGRRFLSTLFMGAYSTLKDAFSFHLPLPHSSRKY